MIKPTSPYSAFVFDSYRHDPATGEVLLTYKFENGPEFTERLVIPPSGRVLSEEEGRALDRALFALHLAAGVSYYKAYCPNNVIVNSGALSKGEADFWTTLYTHGLGEFFYRNDLDFTGLIHFPVSEVVRSHHPQPLLGEEGRKNQGALVPIGGGKDSLMSIGKLLTAQKSFSLFTFGQHERLDQMAQMLRLPQLAVERFVDPQLIALKGQPGVYNGHVPITAILATTAVTAAIIHGNADVIFSNERSANVGNVVMNGMEINHQYSKSLAFERALSNYIKQSISPNIRVFSLLRPFSELAIVQEFVKAGKYFDAITSCNRSFRIVKDGTEQRWCGECPKCAFVFALFAAFVPTESLRQIFGRNFFEHADLVPTYQALVGKKMKPFECVGEPEEVIVALAMAHERGELEDTAVMKWFVAQVLPSVSDLEAMKTRVFTPSADHLVPSEYLSIIGL